MLVNQTQIFSIDQLKCLNLPYGELTIFPGTLDLVPSKSCSTKFTVNSIDLTTKSKQIQSAIFRYISAVYLYQICLIHPGNTMQQF